MKTRWKRRAVAVLMVVLIKATCVGALSGVDDSGQRLAYLARRIDAGDLLTWSPGAPFDGEWKSITLMTSVVAATNLAFRHPEQQALRAADVRRWVQRMETEEVRVFDTAQWRSDAFKTLASPEGHAGYLGELGLAMGAQCLVAGGRHARAEAVVEALARRIDASPTALIETYPGETYVPDNVVVVAAIALDDLCTNQHAHRAILERWVTMMRSTRVDAANGVLTFAPGQQGRGSGASWNALFLPFIDAGFAREQHQALISAFEDTLPLGASAIREWPRGVDRGGDVDSGPLIFGLSSSATGFAMSAHAYANDATPLRRFLVTAETAGTTIGLSERRYLFAPLVGDAVVLAGRTATAWDRRFLSGITPVLDAKR